MQMTELIAALVHVRTLFMLITYSIINIQNPPSIYIYTTHYWSIYLNKLMNIHYRLVRRVVCAW